MISYDIILWFIQKLSAPGNCHIKILSSFICFLFFILCKSNKLDHKKLVVWRPIFSSPQQKSQLSLEWVVLIVLWVSCPENQMSYEWVFLRVNCPGSELSGECFVLRVNCSGSELSKRVNCPRSELYCEWVVLEVSCPGSELSCEWVVQRVNCPRSELYCEWVVLRVNCLRSELFVSELPFE